MGCRAFLGTIALFAFASYGSAARCAEVPDAAFDRIAASARSTQTAPGFSVAVVHDGRVVYAKGFGLADIQQGVAVTPDTRFAIGSLTKQFTAASILLLAQRGKLSLDDPVGKYVPTFPNGAAISLRMLLTQTSGLHNSPSFVEHPWPSAGDIALSKLLAILETDVPDFAPGTKWAYSNTNYTLLADVIGTASGMDERQFLDREIFRPLQMLNSGFGFASQRASPIAIAYRGSVTFTAQQSISLDLYSGAGAGISTVSDMATWDIALIGGRVLQKNTMHDLWTAGALTDGTAVGYAMGFVPTTIAGHREVWHNGLSPGAGGYCYNAIFPDDDLAVVVLSNGYEFTGVPEAMTYRILSEYDAAISQKLLASSPTPSPGEDPAITQRAKAFFFALKRGAVDSSLLSSSFATRLSPSRLSQIARDEAAEDDPVGWSYVGSHPGSSNATIYAYRFWVDGISRVWVFSLDADGKISGSGFT